MFPSTMHHQFQQQNPSSETPILVFGDSLQVPLKTDGKINLFDGLTGTGIRHHETTWLASINPNTRVIANNSESMGIGATALDIHRRTSAGWTFFKEFTYQTVPQGLVVFALGTNNLRHDWFPGCQKHHMALIGRILLKKATSEFKKRNITLLDPTKQNRKSLLKLAQTFLSDYRAANETLEDKLNFIKTMIEPSDIDEYVENFSLSPLVSQFIKDFWLDNSAYQRQCRLSIQMALIGLLSNRNAWLTHCENTRELAESLSNAKIENFNEFDLQQRVKQIGKFAKTNELFKNPEFKPHYQVLVIQSAVISSSKKILKEDDLQALISAIEQNPWANELGLIAETTLENNVNLWFKHFTPFLRKQNFLFVSPLKPKGPCFGCIPTTDHPILSQRLHAISTIYNAIAIELEKPILHLAELQPTLETYLQTELNSQLHTPTQPDGTHLTTLGTAALNISLTIALKRLQVAYSKKESLAAAIREIYQTSPVREQISTLLNLIITGDTAQLSSSYQASIGQLQKQLVDYFVMKDSVSATNQQSVTTVSSTAQLCFLSPVNLKDQSPTMTATARSPQPPQ